jgi:hypothetical protein
MAFGLFSQTSELQSLPRNDVLGMRGDGNDLDVTPPTHPARSCLSLRIAFPEPNLREIDVWTFDIVVPYLIVNLEPTEVIGDGQQ